MMKQYKTKLCPKCGQEYRPMSGNTKHCATCAAVVRKEQKRVNLLRFYSLHPGYSARWEFAHPERKERILVRKQNPESNAAWLKAHPINAMAIRRKKKAKRRLLGFNPLNSPFLGCEGHHINKSDVIYMPKKLHQSIYHNQYTGRGMAEMNALAGAFLMEVKK